MDHFSTKKLRFKLAVVRAAVGFVCCNTSSALAGDSALSALKLLPAEEQSRLVRIERPDDALRPDRWYFDVYAEDGENGLREYVVAEHKIVATREVSQFSSGLTERDVLDNRFLRADSTDVEKLAREYAAANNQVIAALNLTLGKPLSDARPVWTARCFSPSGDLLGSVVVAAENGTVFTHKGFPVEPNSVVTSNEPETHKHGTGSARLHKVWVQNYRSEQPRQNPQARWPLKTPPTTAKLVQTSPNGHLWWSVPSR